MRCCYRRTLSDAQASGGAGHAFNYGGRLAYTQPNTPDMSAAIYRRQVQLFNLFIIYYYYYYLINSIFSYYLFIIIIIINY